MILFMENKPSKLVLELKKLLDDYLRRYPSMTMSSMGKKFGVSSSTLRRIINLETKEDPISSTVLGIASGVTKEHKIEKLIEIFDGEIRLCLEKTYFYMKDCKTPLSYCPDLAEVLANRECYIIYKLAANSSGVEKQELIAMLGVPVTEMLDRLMELGFIYEEAGKIHARAKDFVLPEEISKKHIPELLRFTGRESRYVGTKANIFINWSESVSPEAYKKLLEIQKEATDKICQVLIDKSNMGEVPFFFTCILDTLESGTKKN